MVYCLAKNTEASKPCKHLPKGSFPSQRCVTATRRARKGARARKARDMNSKQCHLRAAFKNADAKPIAVNLWCRVKRRRSASFPDGGVGTARGFKLLAVLHKDDVFQGPRLFIWRQESRQMDYAEWMNFWMEENINGLWHNAVWNRRSMSLVGWLTCRSLRAHAEIRDLVLKKGVLFLSCNPD